MGAIDFAPAGLFGSRQSDGVGRPFGRFLSQLGRASEMHWLLREKHDRRLYPVANEVWSVRVDLNLEGAQGSSPSNTNCPEECGVGQDSRWKKGKGGKRTMLKDRRRNERENERMKEGEDEKKKGSGGLGQEE